jgi:hypothetical protein
MREFVCGVLRVHDPVGEWIVLMKKKKFKKIKEENYAALAQIHSLCHFFPFDFRAHTKFSHILSNSP